MRKDVLEEIKSDYILNSDVVMSEYLRSIDAEYELTSEEKRYLLHWAGEDRFMMVQKDGNVIERWGIIDYLLLVAIIAAIIFIILV